MQESRRLSEITTEIAQIEHRLGVSHALGDTSSSQGISATFNDNARWRSRLDLLRRMRDQLEAKQSGETLPPIPSVNLSFYRPDNQNITL
jgi:hypothetical protein